MTTDDETLEAFVRRLARATTYRSCDLGWKDSIADYWKWEARLWVKKLDKDNDATR
jgi:hypothetical protein